MFPALTCADKNLPTLTLVVTMIYLAVPFAVSVLLWIVFYGFDPN